MRTLSQDKFRITAKTRLLEQGLTVGKLAEKIGKARNTVSMAINHPVFPGVRAKIARALKMEVPA